LKKILKLLKEHYNPKICAICKNTLSPIFTDETVFDKESHAGIYKDAPEDWYPHFDVEYGCENCGNYEHYTYSPEGEILAQRINKVLFDFTTNQFSIIEGLQFIPAGKVPKNVEFGSDKWNKYLDKVLKKAYPKE
jgi:hypothetical protein